MMKNDTIEKKLSELAKLKDQMDTLDYKAEQIKEELKKDMIARGVEVYEFVGSDGVKHQISYKTFSKSKFDSKSFQADHKELYDQYCTVSESTMFKAK